MESVYDIAELAETWINWAHIGGYLLNKANKYNNAIIIIWKHAYAWVSSLQLRSTVILKYYYI